MHHRLFLDANILFSAAWKKTKLRELWELPQASLFSSFYAVKEAEVNLRRLKPDTLKELHHLLEKICLIEGGTSTILSQQMSLPEKDVPILSAAIDIQATHLLTGDKEHFGQYFGKQIGGIFIMPPAMYFNSLTSQGYVST